MALPIQNPVAAAHPASGADAMLLATVGAVFAVEALAKSINPISTLEILQGPIGLTPAVSEVAVVALVGAEFLVASLLIAGLLPRATALVTGAFLLAASALIVHLWVSKSTLGCGCGLTFDRGSVFGDRVVPLARNALLILCLGLGLFLRQPLNPPNQEGVAK